MINYTEIISPNSNPRVKRIERITPHCIVGQMTAKECANMYKFKAGGVASANYIIGKDGEVVLNVPENRRAWTSSSGDNDQKAITFECASDMKPPYAFRDVVYDKLIECIIDIMKRYKRDRLIWIPNKNEALSYKVGEKEMILTVHRWFASVECPGDWLYSRLPDIEKRVNEALRETIIVPDSNAIYRVQIGAFRDYNNALKRLNEIKRLGYKDAFIKADKQ